MPTERGRVPVEAAKAWIRANIATDAPGTRSESGEGGDVEGLVEVRIEKLRREITYLGLQIRRAEGDLVEKAEIRRALTSFSRLIRDKWVNFPDRYGAEIAATCGCEPKLLMAELSKAVRLQLEEIANVRATLPE